MIPFKRGRFITIDGVEWMVEEWAMEMRADYVQIQNGTPIPVSSVIRVCLTLVAGLEQFGDKKDSIDVVRRRFEKEG